MNELQKQIAKEAKRLNRFEEGTIRALFGEIDTEEKQKEILEWMKAQDPLTNRALVQKIFQMKGIHK